jgi:hypothetical protein
VGRGDILPVTDGTVIVADDDQRRRIGKRINYQVRIDAIETDALFFAGVPEAVHINVSRLIRTPEGALRAGPSMGMARHYWASSFLPQTETGIYTPPALSSTR